MGRDVISLAGPFDQLYVRVEDGLVAVSDHPVALGYLFRGLERVAARAPKDPEGVRLTVRYGRADAADRWEGTTFLDRESVTWSAPRGWPVAAPSPDASVVSFVANEALDFPVFPVRISESVQEQVLRMSVRPVRISLGEDGVWAARASGQPAGDGKDVAGEGSAISWLRGVAAGRIDPPFPVDRDLVRVPLQSAELSAKDVRAVAPWRTTSTPGEITGPVGSGPATFLALRTLRHAARGFQPFQPPPEPPAPPPSPAGGGRKPVAQPGEPPPKPGAPLPPPGAKKEEEPR